jgi:hypothetical protein
VPRPQPAGGHSGNEGGGHDVQTPLRRPRRMAPQGVDRATPQGVGRAPPQPRPDILSTPEVTRLVTRGTVTNPSGRVLRWDGGARYLPRRRHPVVPAARGHSRLTDRCPRSRGPTAARSRAPNGTLNSPSAGRRRPYRALARNAPRVAHLGAGLKPATRCRFDHGPASRVPTSRCDAPTGPGR